MTISDDDGQIEPTVAASVVAGVVAEGSYGVVASALLGFVGAFVVVDYYGLRVGPCFLVLVRCFDWEDLDELVDFVREVQIGQWPHNYKHHLVASREQYPLLLTIVLNHLKAVLKLVGFLCCFLYRY